MGVNFLRVTQQMHHTLLHLRVCAGLFPTIRDPTQLLPTSLSLPPAPRRPVDHPSHSLYPSSSPQEQCPSLRLPAPSPKDWGDLTLSPQEHTASHAQKSQARADTRQGHW